MSDREKRRHPRFSSQEIHATLESPMDCRVINLSSSGICFETSRRLTVGHHYYLEVHSQGLSASLEIDLKWCALSSRVQDDDGTEFIVVRAGASFVDIERDSPVGFWDVIDVYPAPPPSSPDPTDQVE